MHYEIYKQLTVFGVRYAWRLRAGNGKILAHGESYKEKDDCWNGINLVKASIGARIEDLTVKGD